MNDTYSKDRKSEEEKNQSSGDRVQAQEGLKKNRAGQKRGEAEVVPREWDISIS